jgi:predicted Na+-dependent transporter
MQQIILIVSAIALGLIFGNFTGGLTFSSAVCLVAGIFLVTPSLFKFHLADFAILKGNMPSVYKNLWINYLLIVAFALAVGFATQDIGIAAALFLLALLPGGGMVMMWIKQSGANVKLGFLIFMLNLALLLPITLIFGMFDNVAASLFPIPDLTIPEHMQGGGKKIVPVAPFMILVVIPFLLSRLILKFFPKLVAFTGKHQQLISKATMFGIVLYLFSLSTAQLLFHVEIMDLLKAIVATSIFYAGVFFIAEKLTDKTPNGKAVYWHIATRYITLALILAVFSVETYGATFILPIMIAYFIQIGFAGFLSKRQIAAMEKN